MPFTNKSLKIAVIIAISIIAIGYGLISSKTLIKGPEIEITEPKNGETLSKSLISITGIAKNISFITLNDRQIYVDNNGNFKETLLLSYGYNIISIKAYDRFKRKIEERLELVYQ